MTGVPGGTAAFLEEGLAGALAARVRALGLTFCLRGLAGVDRITPEAEEIEAEGGLPTEAQALLELAVLGRRVDVATARRGLGPPLYEALVAARLLLVRGDRADLDGLALQATPYGLLLADTPMGFPGAPVRPARAFADDESLPLCDAVARAAPVGRALDLGCGAGLTTLAAARTAEGVLAIDIQPDAVRLARFNVALAGLQDRVQVRQGDLDELLAADERFDRIVASVPSLALPPDTGAVAHAGGEDGAALAVRVLGLAGGRLRPRGELWLGTSVQLRRGQVLPTRLQAALDRSGARIQSILGVPVAIEDAALPIARMIARDDPAQTRAWELRVRESLQVGGADGFAPAVFFCRFP